jgi:RNA 3'-terminal phosphate cyclase
MMPLISLELAAHFHHHGAGGAAHGFHGHGAEQVGDQAADEQADDDLVGRTGRR